MRSGDAERGRGGPRAREAWPTADSASPVEHARAGTRTTRGPAVPVGLVMWLALAAFAVLCLLLRDRHVWLAEYPERLTLPFDIVLNAFMDAFTRAFRWLFRAVSWLLEKPMLGLQALLLWLPWSTALVGATCLAYTAGGPRVAIFAFSSFAYILVCGYWEASMNSLALVAISVPLAVGAGFFAGAMAFRYRWVERFLNPLLDLMQTVPTFAYLVPILILFGFGPVVGMIAGAIYASPPMARNMLLGLRRVPDEIIESGIMSGATPRQLFWHVRVGTALPQILLGVNQTTLAAFSMIIIASVIGSFHDIGWEVLSTMRKARFGESLLAGLVIALMAMMMDRITVGFAGRDERGHRRSTARRWPIAAGLVGATLVLGALVPAFNEFPEGLVVEPAGALNGAVNFIVKNYSAELLLVKNGVLSYVMLPMKLGLEVTVKPFTWGFELTPAMSLAYLLFSVAVVALATRFAGWPMGVALALIFATYYFGTTRTPWPVVLAVVTLISWQIGGLRIAALGFFGLLFMLLGGMWQPAMLSVYLCGSALILACAFGGVLGVIASESRRVSAFLRPINDTLQTMPLFVFLIPVVMFFKIGEVSAVIAIVAYAIVPVIRYTEHGLRHVPEDAVEAARMMGTTRSQLLWHVKLPLALPEIMLGLNQAIMFGLAMLVVTSLVGTKDLGQQIYIALTSTNFGQGAIAGLSMALIAMIADRNIQAWAKRKKAELGLA